MERNMRTIKLGMCCVIVLSVMMLTMIPFASNVYAEDTTISVNAPASVEEGSVFTVYINIGEVTKFNGFQMDVTYNPSVIQITGEEGMGGVSDGLIETTSIPIKMWGFLPIGTQGCTRIFGNLTGIASVTGQGYLARIQFNVVGTAGETTNITLSNVEVLDNAGNSISATLTGDEITVEDGQDDPSSLISVSPASGEVMQGGTFDVNVNISDVANLNAFQFDLTYDSSVIQITGDEGMQGVSDGLINGSTVIPVNMWGFLPPGTQGRVRVLGHMSGVSVVTGEGYLAQIHFSTIGVSGESSGLTLSNARLYNALGDIIPSTSISGSVTVVDLPLEIITTSLPNAVTSFEYSHTLSAQGGTNNFTWSATGLPAGLILSDEGDISGIPTVAGTYNINFTVTDSLNPSNSSNKILSLQIILRGDANGDGEVNMADVTKTERMILNMDPGSVGADTNGDGLINMGDVTRIERIILGI
jgi:hypothetical protein